MGSEMCIRDRSRPGKGIVCMNTSQLGSVHSFLQDSPVFDMDYVSESVFEEILASVLEERFSEIESLTEHQRKALLAVINRKDVFAILPTGHGKSISVAP